MSAITRLYNNLPPLILWNTSFGCIGSAFSSVYNALYNPYPSNYIHLMIAGGFLGGAGALIQSITLAVLQKRPGKQETEPTFIERQVANIAGVAAQFALAKLTGIKIFPYHTAVTIAGMSLFQFVDSYVYDKESPYPYLFPGSFVFVKDIPNFVEKVRI